MGYGGYIPYVGNIVVILIWAPYLFYLIKNDMRDLSSVVFFFLPFALLCYFSVFWSLAPFKTLYASTFFFASLGYTAVIALLVPTSVFIRSIAVTIFFMLVITLLSGRYDTIGAEHHPALIGFFTHKNTTGLFASLGCITSFLLFFSDRNLGAKLFWAIAFVLGFICIYLSKSATSLATIIGVIAILASVYCLSGFPKNLRWIITGLAFLLFVTFLLFIMASHTEIISTILDAFGKDDTGSGRSWLWEEGVKRIIDRPLLGYGYSGFWVEENYYARLYWEMAGIEGVTKGFNFHNLYIETWIELGILGVVVISFYVLSTVFKSYTLIIKQGINLENTFFLSIAVIVFVRSLGTTSIVTFSGMGAFVSYLIFIKVMLDCRRRLHHKSEGE